MLNYSHPTNYIGDGFIQLVNDPTLTMEPLGNIDTRAEGYHERKIVQYELMFNVKDIEKTVIPTLD